ncbi:hypothetical protein SISSUDRAFT_1063701 [Sistotremastrum suecicum HHB10207 ss-3]|uniref:DUF6535 domain-containing protein n=1 Tax=Sistotremastrum suecicum HHB10207 ss-3 TaxID=1314776 RepID=A0A166BGV8_9AGAM|nr:hypothetical protein SISSUDRAFT_1063701 [Sistotremastrum suecicum HHB10207 ss-3]
MLSEPESFSATSHIEQQTPNTAPDPFDTPLFNRLLGLIEKQNVAAEEQKKTLQEQKKTLDEQSKKFDVLIRDALKDDQPYEEKPLRDEPTWSALYEIATTKMKEEAEEWKGLMDVSLVFIAIFLAVLTAFLVPAAQSLSQSPGNSGAPTNSTLSNSTSLPAPLPPRSAENVCALYYLALITAMCNAVLCVLGRQWVGKLLSRPAGKTYREWTIRHEERKTLAYVWIKPLVAILYWSLLLSIGIFIAGLLYQLRNLSTSFDGTARTLEATWGLGLVLVAGILATVAATSIHAVRFESSPFEGSLSKSVAKILLLLGERWKWAEKLRVKVDWKFDHPTQIRTYMRLVSEASDPKLLDRVVPSFSIVFWLVHGGLPLDLLKSTYERLMATDTSIRVRETVLAHLSRFVAYCRKSREDLRGRLSDKPLLDFLIEKCSFPDYAPAATFFSSFYESNDDLLPVSSLPTGECIAHLLCTYDHNGDLGDRSLIFFRAVDHCYTLLKEDKSTELHEILAHVDDLSILRSFIRAPDYLPSFDFIHFIVLGREIYALRGLSSFINIPENYAVYDQNMALVLDAIVAGLDSPVPPDVDISPFISSLCQEPRRVSWGWASDAVSSILIHCDISSLSDLGAVHKFLRLCLSQDLFDDEDGFYHTRPATVARARLILEQNRVLFEHVGLHHLDSPEAPPVMSDSSLITRGHSPNSVQIEMTDVPSPSVDI